MKCIQWWPGACLMLVLLAAARANAAGPTAVDVFAATIKSTTGNSSSAQVILEGADADTLAAQLTYRIMSAPANGSLSDPDDGDRAISTGNLAGQSVTYTPDTDFTGTDTFTYRVRDGSTNSSVRTAFITVFEDYRDVAQQIGLDIDGEVGSGGLGSAVALSSDGQTLAIGTSFFTTGIAPGYVSIYRWNGSSWVQRGNSIAAAAAGDGTGRAIDLSSDGEIVVIGAPFNGSAGTVRVFSWSGTDWTRVGNVIAGESNGEAAGSSVALSSDGQTLAIGARENSEVESRAGKVRIYRFDSTLWEQIGADISGEIPFEFSGTSVDLSSDGQSVAVGAPYRDDLDRLEGRTRIYRWTGTAWAKVGSDIIGESGEDFSGESVAMAADGETVAIGAWRNDGGGADAGHVRVYRWNGTAWTQLGVDIDGESANNFSGAAIALSSDGQVVAIGATGNNDVATGSGHVRIYRWTGERWDQVGLDIDGEARQDLFGRSVALSSDGQTVAIGAANNDDAGSDAGQVRVFSLSYLNTPPSAADVFAASPRSTGGNAQSALVVLEGSDIDDDTLSYRIVSLPTEGTLTDPDNGGAMVSTGLITGSRVTFTPANNFTGTASFRYRVNDGSANSSVRTATITVFDDYRDDADLIGAGIDGEAAGDLSGYSLALSSDGRIVAISARANDGGGTNAGHVRVYERSGTSWTQRGADIDGEAAGDEAGRSLALSGDGRILAVGAPINDASGRAEAGLVQVYLWDGAVWVRRGESIKGEGVDDRTGDLNSLAISSDGNTLAIGAGSNDEAGTDAGHVRVYRWGGSGWSQLGVDIDGAAAGDRLGTSVALSSDGRVLAVGIRDRDSSAASAGQVRVFVWTGSIWMPRGTALDGEAADDGFGQSVALSSDGSVLAAGSQLNDDAGTDSGHVRVYQWDGSNYVQKGPDINGEGTGDRSGLAIDLSGDGLTLAVGARRNDGGGSSAGHTRVRRWNGIGWARIGNDIDGELAGDNSGWTVSLSADGRTLAVSDVQHDGEGVDAGRVRVFNLSNVPPQISNMPPTTVGSARNFSFQMEVLDLDPGDGAIWSLSNKPSWLSIDVKTGQLSGTPGNGDVGTRTGIVISVSDNDGTTDTLTVSLTVPDSDGDGLIDGRDDCVTTPSGETATIDSSGCGPSERDTDGDGVNDSGDAFPEDPTEQLDSDGDGFGDNQELDAGSDPNDADDLPMTSGLPVWLIYEGSRQR